jgi:hypothetical protein
VTRRWYTEAVTPAAEVSMSLCLIALVLGAFLPAAAVSGTCCAVPDNGTGTPDLPPSCSPAGYTGHLRLVEGLLPGDTIEMDAVVAGFSTTETPGGVLGGAIHTWTATITLEVAGTGSLTGFQRTLTVPVSGETHTGPRQPGDAVQSFDTRVTAFDGILTNDYDFGILQFERDENPSPGHTDLYRMGPPGSDFAAESYFDYRYRIQFEGRQESEWIEGFRGITQDVESRFSLCLPSTSGIPPGEAAVRARAIPNPMRTSTAVEISYPLEGTVEATLFDAQGRRVRILHRGRAGPGTRIEWDGRASSGLPARPGLYFLRIEAPHSDRTVRIVKLP